MSGISAAMAREGGILILRHEDGDVLDAPAKTFDGSRIEARLDFAQTPFAVAAPAALRTARSRMVDDAEDWAVCHARRLRLEEQLALQEEFRLVPSERADRLREKLAQIEKRVGDVPIDDVLVEMVSVQRELYADCDERDWW